MISVKEQGKLGVRMASELFGIPIRTLQYWIKIGWVVPKEYRKGYGHPTILSTGDLLRIGVMAELRARGCGLQRTREAIKYIEERGNEIYERRLFVK